ncbi:MAG: OmpH family outer membrane protein [Phycisphaerales bacterium]|nr:OmpH family outer membrane protein [Phycisphaerales bacterium]
MNQMRMWRWNLVAAVAFLALAVLQVGTQVAGAASRAVPTPVPVATVDLSRLLDMLDEKAVMEKDLQAFIDKLQADIQREVDAVKAAEQDMDVAAPDQQEAFSIKYLQLAAQAKVDKEIADQRISRKMRRSQLDLFNKIKEASAAYAKAEGFALVFCDDSAMEIPPNLTGPALQAAILSQRLVYVQADAVDITDAVSARMNASFAQMRAK